MYLAVAVGTGNEHKMPAAAHPPAAEPKEDRPLAHARINFLCGDVDVQFRAFLQAKEEAARSLVVSAAAAPAGEAVSLEEVHLTLSAESTLSATSESQPEESQPEATPSDEIKAKAEAAAVEDAAPTPTAFAGQDDAQANTNDARMARTRTTAGDRAVCWASTRPSDWVVAVHFTPGNVKPPLTTRRPRRGTLRPIPAIVSSQAA